VGLWAMPAAPAADGIVADCNAFDSTDDRNFLARDLFSPGLRKLGGFEGVLAINTSGPLLLHNLGDKFTTAYLRHVYKGMHVPERYREEKVALGEEQVAEWISKLRL
jgi:hypothetical protein